jgi:hypothetical protein
MRFTHLIAILAAVILQHSAAVLAQDPAGQGAAETPVEEGESSPSAACYLLLSSAAASGQCRT